MKKLITLTLIFAMLMSLMPTASARAAVMAPYPNVVVGTNTVTKQQAMGSVALQVTVPVYIYYNAGIATFMLNVEYEDGLQLTNVSRGDLTSAGIFQWNSLSGDDRITWLNLAGGVQGDGVLFNLTFTVTGTWDGTKGVSVSLVGGYEKNMAYYSGASAFPYFTAGGVHMTESEIAVM